MLKKDFDGADELTRAIILDEKKKLFGWISLRLKSFSIYFIDLQVILYIFFIEGTNLDM